MHTTPFDPDMPDRLDDLWNTEVQPALEKLHFGLVDHGLVREIARAGKEDVLKLLTSGSALDIGVAAVTSLSDALATATGVVGPTIAATTKAHSVRSASRKAAKDNDLFYLYEVQGRLTR